MGIDPTIIQSLTTIFVAIVSGIFGIIIAKIQTSSDAKSQTGILLPPGVSLTHRSNKLIIWFIIFTILGGLVSYSFSGGLNTRNPTSISTQVPSNTPSIFTQAVSTYTPTLLTPTASPTDTAPPPTNTPTATPTRTLMPPTKVRVVLSSHNDNLNIRAYIDGLSNLVIVGNSVYWNHLVYVVPGREGASNEPTYINGTAWLPIWPDLPNEDNADCNCRSSTYAGIPTLASEDQVVLLTIITARNTVSIIQQPNVANHYTLIIQFDDRPQYFANWYEINLTYRVP